MSLFEIFALLLGLAVLIGLVKSKLLKPPPAIGLTAMALLAAAALVALDLYMPGLGVGASVRALLRAVDFHAAPVEAMLCGLLFAAALHVDMSGTGRLRLRLALAAILGVLIATFVVGGAVWVAATVLGFALPLAWALVFGAAIAPGDPIAVLGMARAVRAPALLEARVMAESAFAAGAALIVFAFLLAIATGALTIEPAPEAGRTLLVAMGGGLGLGIAAGLIVSLLLRWIDEQGLAVLITLALLIGVYAGAGLLQINAPLAALAAGLMIGLETRRLPLPTTTRAHLSHFWLLADALLKALLFLFIGLQAAGRDLDGWIAALAAVAVVGAAVARWLAVSVPFGLLRLRERFPPGARRLFVWGGPRGGLSAALALSIPLAAATEPLLVLACAVIAASIVVQGLTLVPIVRRRIRREEEAGLYAARPAPPPRTAEPTPLEPAPEDAEAETEPAPPKPESAMVTPALASTAADSDVSRPTPPPRPSPGVTEIPHPEIVADPGGSPPAEAGTAPPRPDPVDSGPAPAPGKHRT